MIYALYNADGDRVGGCEIRVTDEHYIAVELVKRTNAMVEPDNRRATVKAAVHPVVSKNYHRYDVLYVEGERVVERFYAIPQVMGHA